MCVESVPSLFKSQKNSFMTNEHVQPEGVTNFLLFTIVGFVSVFIALMIFLQWHGDYIPHAAHQNHLPIEHNAASAAVEKEIAPPEVGFGHQPATAINIELPNKQMLEASKGGMEDKLVEYIKSDAAPAGNQVWFDFDNVNFDVSSAQLTAESNAQLQNVANILKAYPKVKVKVGGYTDNTGDSTGNMKLSQARADAIANALIKYNVPPAQIVGAEGYGSQFAKVPASASDQERAKDRRMSLSVREK